MILMLVPMMCFAEEPSMQMQMLDNEIERLTKQRDEKFAALQKCEETTKGFKIAGIATLAATGVGIYGNIKLSQKLQGKGSKKSGGSDGLNAKVLSASESQKQMCDEECEGSYTDEQCIALDKCWAAARSDCSCK